MKDSMIFDTLKVASLNKNATGTLDGKKPAYAGLGASGEKTDMQRKNSSAGDLFKSTFLSSKKKQFSEKLWFCG